MLKVIIEMWPKGQKEGKFVHSKAIIYNNVQETMETGGTYGTYEGYFTQSYKFNPHKIWKTGRIEGIHRQNRGVWDILFCLLYKAGLWERNKYLLEEEKGSKDAR